jgi:branched-subunit amino acid aminotransferase/4-amino-4-deoxychorismate lyase
MFVFLNNRFVVEKSAKVSVFDPGFLAGEGVFETILIEDGEPQLLTGHLARLQKSAKMIDLKIPYSKDHTTKNIQQLIKKNRLQRGMLRITVTPKTFLMTTKLIPARPKTASVCFVEMERCLPHLKTLNYLPTVLAQRQAEKQGFDEALLVDKNGYVTEGGRTNFFWVKNGKLHTPPLGSALAGITRGAVIQLAKRLHIPFSEKQVKPAELLKADEIFLTNAPMQIWPASKIEKRQVSVGLVTKKLMAAYINTNVKRKT